MKPAYSDIAPVTGGLVSGICAVKIIPREWIAEEIKIDFGTNKVLSQAVLFPNKNWLKLQLVESSYEFDEKPKSNKGGNYYETSLSGTSNDLSADLLQVLETLRYSEFVVIAMDRQKRYRIIGNQDAGMVMQITNKQTNNQGGNQVITIDFTIQTETLSPFFEA